MNDFVPGPGLIKEVWVRAHSEARREDAAAAFDSMYAEVVRKASEAAWDECLTWMPFDLDWKIQFGDLNPHRKESA